MRDESGLMHWKKGIIFDNGEKDSKERRPTMILLGKNNVTGEYYYLAATSNVANYPAYCKKYFLIKNNLLHQLGLYLPTMINLEEIYKDKSFDGRMGHMPRSVCREVIKKFVTYQDEFQHKYYSEVKEVLKGYGM